jgi:hypothetical protein
MRNKSTRNLKNNLEKKRFQEKKLSFQSQMTLFSYVGITCWD